MLLHQKIVVNTFLKCVLYIISQAKLWVKQRDIQLSRGFDSVQWVISVPAIWSDESKQLMVKWCQKAGIGNTNFLAAHESHGMIRISETDRIFLHRH